MRELRLPHVREPQPHLAYEDGTRPNEDPDLATEVVILPPLIHLDYTEVVMASVADSRGAVRGFVAPDALPCQALQRRSPAYEIGAPDLIEVPLVRLAQSGEEEAISELLRRTRPLVERTVGRLCHDRGLIEDVVQSCLLIVLTELPSLRTPEAFISWVQGIVRNVCCKEARRESSLRAATIRLTQGRRVRTRTWTGG